MEWRQNIYMILKEGINNLVKYSEATQVSIGVSYRDGILEIYCGIMVGALKVQRFIQEMAF